MRAEPIQTATASIRLEALDQLAKQIGHDGRAYIRPIERGACDWVAKCAQSWGYPRRIERDEINYGFWVMLGDFVIAWLVQPEKLPPGHLSLHAIAQKDARLAQEIGSPRNMLALEVIAEMANGTRLYVLSESVGIPPGLPPGLMRRYLRRHGWLEDEHGSYRDLGVLHMGDPTEILKKTIQDAIVGAASSASVSAARGGDSSEVRKSAARGAGGGASTGGAARAIQGATGNLNTQQLAQQGAQQTADQSGEGLPSAAALLKGATLAINEAASKQAGVTLTSPEGGLAASRQVLPPRVPGQAQKISPSSPGALDARAASPNPVGRATPSPLKIPVGAAPPKARAPVGGPGGTPNPSGRSDADISAFNRSVLGQIVGAAGSAALSQVGGAQKAPKISSPAPLSASRSAGRRRAEERRRLGGKRGRAANILGLPGNRGRANVATRILTAG